MEIITQWQRLILPPPPLIPAGGEQLATGNQYPNVQGPLDFAAHAEGQITYAVDLAWIDPVTGEEMVRAGVLDIDEGPESVATAETLASIAAAQSLAALVEWSGGKGCHVWIFSEPVRVKVMRAALKKLKGMVPHKGELIPLDNRRVKLAPCWHQRAGAAAFFFSPGSKPQPMTDKGLLAEIRDGQVELLESIAPTPANVLVLFCREAEEERPLTDPALLIPDLSKLGGAHTPCFQEFIRHGGTPALGGYDKNNLTLARYCRGAGIERPLADKFAQTLARCTASDLETTKDLAAKLRHWDSIQEAPSIEAAPFSCTYMLKAKQALGFDCTFCPVRPAGIHVKTSERLVPVSATSSGTLCTDHLKIEAVLADQLLAVALKGDVTGGRIDSGIFPESSGTFNNMYSYRYPLRGLIWRALEEGCRDAAAVATWLDRRPITDLVDAQTARQARKSSSLAATVRQIVNEQATLLVGHLQSCSEIDEPQRETLFARAEEITAKRFLDQALASTRDGLLQPDQDLLGLVNDLQQAAGDLQRTHGADFGVPLADHATELLEGLIAHDRPMIPTPFPYLNTLLGGGLLGGRLYVMAAPPGAGKTTFTAQMADHAASLHVPTAFVAMEMGREQLFAYALARQGGINSAKIESRSYCRSEQDHALVAGVADGYLGEVAPWLSVIEGDYFTTTARLTAWVAQARARYGLGPTDPVLVVIDYLQLLNTGIEAMDSQPNETPKISHLAVQAKQLARDTGAAVLVISDVTKAEQGSAWNGSEFTMNALRGSNRIAHAADCVMALYSEQSQGDGGKAAKDPWEILADKLKNSSRAADFVRSLEDARYAYPAGGPSAAVYSRLELLKNRGGQGRGSQLLIYERAYHRFQDVELKGQAEAEGRR